MSELDLKQEADKLINDIFEWKNENCDEDMTITDVILEYSTRNDVEVEEIGAILSESEEFKKMYWQELIDTNFVRTEKKEEKISEDEW